MKIGTNYVFSSIPDIKLVLPPGTLRYKIRERPGEFATIFIKTRHGISQHYLQVVNGELHPGNSLGSNIRGKRP